MDNEAVFIPAPAPNHWFGDLLIFGWIPDPLKKCPDSDLQQWYYGRRDISQGKASQGNF